MADLTPSGAARRLARARELAPGVATAALIALAATFLSDHYGAPVMLFALLIGMAFGFLAEEPRCAAGVAFSARTVLRIGVAFLGARITFSEIAALGPGVFASVAALMALTIATGFVAAPLFGRGWRFALLTGGAVAICGASAALALAAVIPANDKLERNTLFTVVAVTTLSTFAMVAYPLLFAALGLSDAQAGFLIGATIHDVAQVVGAGYSISDEAGAVATVVKLTRVALLPVVLLIVVLALRGAGHRAGGVQRPPFFLIGFIALVLANSVGMLPAVAAEGIADASRWLLVTAIAALGMKTRLKAIAEVGGGHAAIVCAETAILLLAAVLLVTVGGGV